MQVTYGVAFNLELESRMTVILLFMLETSPYEKINIKTMKFALRRHSRTSNFGCRVELGNFRS